MNAPTVFDRLLSKINSINRNIPVKWNHAGNHFQQSGFSGAIVSLNPIEAGIKLQLINLNNQI
jgi:hypothetical protein